MFDLSGNERLAAWKFFRNTLETSPQPLESVADFWAKAPFVSSYLNPLDPESWPDPWHLILDNRYDDLAIALGMLYTILLTDRFSSSNLEIYMTVNNKKNPLYFLLVDNLSILNYEYRAIYQNSETLISQSSKIYPTKRKN